MNIKNTANVFLLEINILLIYFSKNEKVLRTKVSVNNSLKLMLNYAKSCYQNQISDK